MWEADHRSPSLVSTCPFLGGAKVIRQRFLNWVVVLIVVVVWLRGCVLRPGTRYPGLRFNGDTNATWLDETWCRQPHTERQVRRLANQLRAHRICYVFVYITRLQENGQFHPGYTYAGDFVGKLYLASPDIKTLAWVELPVGDRARLLGSGMRLSDAETRERVATICSWLTREIGFEGVHLQVYPLDDADPAYRQLLWEVRRAIGPRAVLSVSAPAVATLPLGLLGKWSTRDYVVTAPLVDQILVESHDSWLPWEWMYSWWLRWQVVRVTRALTESASNAHVLFSIPAHDRPSPKHIARGETVGAGLRGIIAGLNDAESHPDVVDGVAIHAFRDVDSREWDTYDRLWLGKEPFR